MGGTPIRGWSEGETSPLKITVDFDFDFKDFDFIILLDGNPSAMLY
jgi:hypothetical protein